MGLHRIGNSKEPTINQIIKMSANLRRKFKVYTSIEIVTDAHTNNNDIDVNYRIYISDITNKKSRTWPETIKAYRDLMKREV